MKKKSKGRVRKFEQENKVLAFPEDAARSYENRGSADEDRAVWYGSSEEDAPLYGNEGYGDPDYYDPDADFTRNESYEPSAEFDIDAFMAEGWENISRQAEAAASVSHRSGTDGTGEAEKADRPRFAAADAYGEQASDEPGPAVDPMVHRPRQNSKEERKKKRVGAQKRRRRLIYLAVFAVALVIVFFTVQNLITLKMEERELLQQQRELEARKAELEEELTQVEEQDYIEQQAREQLHMIKPGEILYLLPDHDEE